MQFNRSLFQTRSGTALVRTLAILALSSSSLAFAGSFSVRKNLDTIVAMAPAPVLVKKGFELRTAEAAAAKIEGAQAFLGAGESMEPIYASRTAIVVTPVDFAQLCPGMSVVYVNQDGRGVAHTLVKKTRHGWVAQGVNNPDRDDDLVTSANLVGVISQAYASSDTPLRREIASRTLLKVASSSSTQQQVASNL
jgi:hypothetical protein